MATSYGSRPPTFGRFNGYPHSPGASRPGASRYTSGVASALSGGSPLSGGTGYGGYNAPSPLTHNPEASGGTRYVGPQAPAQPSATAPTAQQPAAAGAYDLNTDPILQQIQALAGRSDQEAQAGALKQKQQLLLGYGDQNLAQSILGQGDPIATAAGQNPTSVLAGLGHQHDQHAHNLDESLNANNLFYSGARILQQQEEARAYQEALAQAAQEANGGLDSIAGNLAAALGQNQQQRIQGGSDAYSRAIQEALAGGFTPGGGTGGAADAIAAGPTDSIGGPGVVAPPDMGFNQPVGPGDIRSLLAALYSTAGGQSGGAKPVVDIMPRRTVRAY